MSQNFKDGDEVVVLTDFKSAYKVYKLKAHKGAFISNIKFIIDNYINDIVPLYVDADGAVIFNGEKQCVFHKDAVKFDSKNRLVSIDYDYTKRQCAFKNETFSSAFKLCGDIASHIAGFYIEDEFKQDAFCVLMFMVYSDFLVVCHDRRLSEGIIKNYLGIRQYYPRKYAQTTLDSALTLYSAAQRHAGENVTNVSEEFKDRLEDIFLYKVLFGPVYFKHARAKKSIQMCLKTSFYASIKEYVEAKLFNEPDAYDSRMSVLASLFTTTDDYVNFKNGKIPVNIYKHPNNIENIEQYLHSKYIKDEKELYEFIADNIQKIKGAVLDYKTFEEYLEDKKTEEERFIENALKYKDKYFSIPDFVYVGNAKVEEIYSKFKGCVYADLNEQLNYFIDFINASEVNVFGYQWYCIEKHIFSDFKVESEEYEKNMLYWKNNINSLKGVFNGTEEFV